MSTSEKKSSAGVLASVIQFLALSGGREKVCRLIQYYCKFLSTKYQEQFQTIIYERNAIATKKTKTDALMGAAGMTRKILRFGPSITKVIQLVQGIQQILTGTNKQPLPIAILETLSALWIGIFFICDHYAWLFKMGLVSNEAVRATMQFWSTFGWFLDCITGLIKSSLLYSSKKSLEQQKPLLIDTFRIACDFVVAYSFVRAGSLNGKTVGILGSVTSAIGIYQMWK